MYPRLVGSGGLGWGWVDSPDRVGGLALLSGPCCAPELSGDLDQLKEILKVTGTPPDEFVQRLQSADVSRELDRGWRGWALPGAGPHSSFPHRRKTT